MGSSGTVAAAYGVIALVVTSLSASISARSARHIQDEIVAMAAGADSAARGGTIIGATVPRIETIIHTDEDTIDKIHPQDMARALPVLENAIRLIDKQP